MNKVATTKPIMNVVINFIKRPDAPKPLGRWYYSEKNNDKKVDWSNADHCGCCGPFEKIKKK